MFEKFKEKATAIHAEVYFFNNKAEALDFLKSFLYMIKSSKVKPNFFL